MRALSTTLLNAQLNLDKPPLWKAVLSGTTTIGYDRTRVLKISHDELPTGDVVELTLNNSDGALTALDFEHYQTVISYGYDTGVARSAWVAGSTYAVDDVVIPITPNGYQYRCSVAGTSHAATEPTWPTTLGTTVANSTVTWEMDGYSGNEYSRTSPLRVRTQELHSGRGILKCVLRPKGILDQLGEDKAISIYTQDTTDTQTVKTLISAICGATIAPYVGYPAVTVVYDSEDSLIDTFIPKEYFSIQLNESRLDKVEELLDYTGCKMREGNDGKLHIFVPTQATVNTLYENYITGDNSAAPIYGLSLYCGQTFTPSIAHPISSVKLLIYRLGSPGTVTVSIRATNQGKPTGSDLCVGTTDGDTLTTNTAGEWREITFSASTALTASTMYAIVVRALSGAVLNRVFWRCDSTSATYANGTYTSSYDSGSNWANISKRDTMFEEWGLGYDYTYEWNVRGSHNFWNKSVRLRFVNPNKEVVMSAPTHTPSYTGSATSATSYALAPKQHTTYRRLASDAQGAAIAAAIIERYELDAEKGFAIVPMNAAQEIWDYVKVIDARQGDTRTGNLQYIHRDVEIHFDGRPLTWTMMFAFGKVSTQSIMSNLLTSGDEARLSNAQILAMFDSITEYLESLQERQVWTKEVMPESLDDIIDGTSYKRLLSTDISAGHINLTDVATYQAGYDPSSKRRVFTAAGTATPAVPYDTGDMWIPSVASTATPVKRCTVANTTVYNAGDWTALTIDELADGTIYKQILSTDITAGRINLTAVAANTALTGTWYSHAGVDINASTGINIYGVNNALVTRAAETTAIQCYVGADGGIYAGAGAVKLDAAGIKVTGQFLNFYAGTVAVGIAGYASSNMYFATSGVGTTLMLNADGQANLVSNADVYINGAASTRIHCGSGDIYLDANMGWVYFVDAEIDLDGGATNGGDIYHVGDITTKVGSVNIIGEDDTRFLNVYSDNFPACPVPTVQSALALIKSIKDPVKQNGRHGERYYFKDTDFPDEMKVESYNLDKETKKKVKTGEKDVELIRTVGVLIQAVRELTDKVEALEAK